MDRDGLTVVPETNGARVTELAGEPAGQVTDQQPDQKIGAITKAGGTRAALLTGAAACLVAAGIAALVRTPPHPDAALTDLQPR
jgi:hypothetical protein